jgi:hypothetical protein
VAGWLFFRVARSSRIDLDMIVARALKNSQLTCGESHAYFGDRTLARRAGNRRIGQSALKVRLMADSTLSHGSRVFAIGYLCVALSALALFFAFT